MILRDNERLFISFHIIPLGIAGAEMKRPLFLRELQAIDGIAGGNLNDENDRIEMPGMWGASAC